MLVILSAILSHWEVDQRKQIVGFSRVKKIKLCGRERVRAHSVLPRALHEWLIMLSSLSLKGRDSGSG